MLLHIELKLKSYYFFPGILFNTSHKNRSMYHHLYQLVEWKWFHQGLFYHFQVPSTYYQTYTQKYFAIMTMISAGNCSRPQSVVVSRWHPLDLTSAFLNFPAIFFHDFILTSTMNLTGQSTSNSFKPQKLNLEPFRILQKSQTLNPQNWGSTQHYIPCQICVLYTL